MRGLRNPEQVFDVLVKAGTISSETSLSTDLGTDHGLDENVWKYAQIVGYEKYSSAMVPKDATGISAGAINATTGALSFTDTNLATGDRYVVKLTLEKDPFSVSGTAS